MSSGRKVQAGWARFKQDEARAIKADRAMAVATGDTLMVRVHQWRLDQHYDLCRPTMERIEQAHLPEVVKSYRRWRERERVGARKGGQS